ncbi:hypothetical protein IV203_030808 [Nitzschia inconspicua]|uniref:Uncharacterized protein n=1 Tax=Nitzschia inconspicua TaxID=303405 RepID=A0A9K3Q2I9_9STRA|nr:hypothetical protein IV203_030808 [Nitzschia inconspicua]
MGMGRSEFIASRLTKQNFATKSAFSHLVAASPNTPPHAATLSSLSLCLFLFVVIFVIHDPYSFVLYSSATTFT